MKNSKKLSNEYEKPVWAIQQIKRLSGLIEDICSHGVGHPNIDFLEKNPQYEKAGYNVHGCCGCCGTNIEEKKSKPLKPSTQRTMVSG